MFAPMLARVKVWLQLETAASAAVKRVRSDTMPLAFVETSHSISDPPQNLGEEARLESLRGNGRRARGAYSARVRAPHG